MGPAVKRIGLFCILVALFFGGAFSVPGILERFSRKLPENYRLIATEAINRGDHNRALQITERRINQFAYDFDALYIRADTQAKLGKPTEAADTMKEAMRRVPAARSSKVKSVGYDEAKTLLLTSRYLWQAGLFAEAAEMTRAAIDAGSSRVGEEQQQRLTKFPTDPEALLAQTSIAFRTRDMEGYRRLREELTTSSPRFVAEAAVLHSRWLEFIDRDFRGSLRLLRDGIRQIPHQPIIPLALANTLQRRGSTTESLATRAAVMNTTGCREIGPGLFQLPVGASATTSSIALGRNGSASAQINTGVYRVTSLLFSVSGSRALGIAPIVVVRVDGEEMARVYADPPNPKEFDLQLWPKGAPKNIKLEFEFINDAYDPVTRADRNVTISDVLLH